MAFRLCACDVVAAASAMQQQLKAIQIPGFLMNPPRRACERRALRLYRKLSRARKTLFLNLLWMQVAFLGQFQHSIGDPARQVTHNAVFACKVAGDAAYAQCLDARDICHNRRCAFCLVSRYRFRRKLSGIHKRVVEDRCPRVFVNTLDVL